MTHQVMRASVKDFKAAVMYVKLHLDAAIAAVEILPAFLHLSFAKYAPPLSKRTPFFLCEKVKPRLVHPIVIV